jgi:hypothetical protein
MVHKRVSRNVFELSNRQRLIPVYSVGSRYGNNVSRHVLILPHRSNRLRFAYK